MEEKKDADTDKTHEREHGVDAVSFSSGVEDVVNA
jgi:hypothetical protein